MITDGQARQKTHRYDLLITMRLLYSFRANKRNTSRSTMSATMLAWSQTVRPSVSCEIGPLFLPKIELETPSLFLTSPTWRSLQLSDSRFPVSPHYRMGSRCPTKPPVSSCPSRCLTLNTIIRNQKLAPNPLSLPPFFHSFI